MTCQDNIFNTLVCPSSVIGLAVQDTRCRGHHRASACTIYIGSYNIMELMKHRLPFVPGDIDSVVENE